MIDPRFSNDMDNEQLLYYELKNQELKHLVMEYQDQPVDVVAENDYCLEGTSNIDYFREKMR